MMILSLTAKSLERNINLFTKDTSETKTPVKLEANPEAKKADTLNILFHDRRFWSLYPYKEPESLEVRGMEDPSQSERGKHKKKKGPTLNTKTKPLNTKSKRDEKRR